MGPRMGNFTNNSPKYAPDFGNGPAVLQHLCKNYICAASRNTRDRIMLIRAKHRTIV